jgi:SAM-dependent methyltransferase
MKNIQSKWEDAAEAWTDFVRTGKDYYRDELNNPAMFDVLGDINGKRILDLACGEGYTTRVMAQKGAAVSGVDFSKKMIEYAVDRERKDALGITYHVTDADDLHFFEDDTFDIVTCFMALQDIENYCGAVNEVSRVLKRRGKFVFVIPHPCFERRTVHGTIIGGWEYKEGTEKSGSPLYYKVDKYFDTGSYIISWDMERLTHHFETTTFHRTLTDYADALWKAGLLISRLIEPRPTERGLLNYPMRENLRIPQSLVFETVKCTRKNEP